MNLKTAISGGSFLPLSGKPAKSLVVILHGYGGNGQSLFHTLAPVRSAYPDLAFAVPNGPFLLNEDSFAWIRLSVPILPKQLWDGAVLVTPLLDDYINKELKLLGLNNNQLILIGFSQGAIMALHIGLRRETAPSAVIALSGYSVGQHYLNEIISIPPVYLISGVQDTIVTPSFVAETGKALADHGINVHTTMIVGLGHSINQAVIDTLNETLENVFQNRGCCLMSNRDIKFFSAIISLLPWFVSHETKLLQSKLPN